MGYVLSRALGHRASTLSGTTDTWGETNLTLYGHVAVSNWPKIPVLAIRRKPTLDLDQDPKPGWGAGLLVGAKGQAQTGLSKERIWPLLLLATGTPPAAFQFTVATGAWRFHQQMWEFFAYRRIEPSETTLARKLLR